MIGKTKIGKSFGGCVNYCIVGKKGEKEDRGEFIHYNMCFGNRHDVIRDFNDVRDLNSNIEKPVWHQTFSFAESDRVTRENIIEISKQFAEDLGFKDNQYAVIEHTDTPHQHIHIILNRVGFDGKVVSDSNNYRKTAEFCRKIEKQYNLTEVLNPDKFLKKQERGIERQDNRKEHFKQVIRESLTNVKNIDDFIKLLGSSGIKVELGRGIAFIDEKNVRFKGSQLKYSLDTIKKEIEYNKLPSLEIKPVKSNNREINLSL